MYTIYLSIYLFIYSFIYLFYAYTLDFPHRSAPLNSPRMARPKRLLPKLAVERPNVACPRMLRAMQGIDEPTKSPRLVMWVKQTGWWFQPSEKY